MATGERVFNNDGTITDPNGQTILEVSLANPIKRSNINQPTEWALLINRRQDQLAVMETWRLRGRKFTVGLDERNFRAGRDQTIGAIMVEEKKTHVFQVRPS